MLFSQLGRVPFFGGPLCVVPPPDGPLVTALGGLVPPFPAPTQPFPKIAGNKANPGFGLGPSFMDVGGVNERVQQPESSVTLDGGFDGARVVPPLDTVLLPPSSPHPNGVSGDKPVVSPSVTSHIPLGSTNASGLFRT